MPPGDQSRSAISLVFKGSFARLWWAGLISSAGDWVTIFATLAIADNIAGGAGTLAAILSRVLPGLLFGAVVGVIADRVDRKKLIVLSDVGRGLLVPTLAFVGNIPTLVLINLGMEFLSLLGQSPRAAVIPTLVKKPNIVTANSLTMGAAYGTIPVGAAFNWFLGALPEVTLGGLVPDANAEVALAFFVDAFTFLGSGVLVATLPTMTRRLGAARRGDGRFALKASLTDLADGGRYMWATAHVRRVILGMSAALFGGGTVIILGIPFVDEVLKADIRGFFAVVTALGFGAAVGIAGVSLYAERLLRRDVVFSLSLGVTGLGLMAASMTSTVGGASSWLAVMGIGAGAAYVMGLTHIHEEVSDELRGRVFAAMFALMRIGLFVSMSAAIPIEGFIQQIGPPPPFDQSTRDVLFLGGATILLSGATILWSIRRVFLRPKIGHRTRAMLEQAARYSSGYAEANEDADDEEAET